MKFGDWLLLAIIGGYCLWLLLRRKKKKCNGNCTGCHGCHP